MTYQNEMKTAPTGEELAQLPLTEDQLNFIEMMNEPFEAEGKWHVFLSKKGFFDLLNQARSALTLQSETTELKKEVDRLKSQQIPNDVLKRVGEALEWVLPALDPNKNEATSHPWWAIVRKGSFGRYTLLAGPFFSRQSATEFQQMQAHNLPKNTLVYCYSGQYCSGRGDWVHFLDSARAALSALKPYLKEGV